jgi:hypothetical protein
MMENLPARRKVKKFKEDYHLFDQELCNKICTVKDSLINDKVPRMITKNMIMSRLSPLEYGRIITAPPEQLNLSRAWCLS